MVCPLKTFINHFRGNHHLLICWSPPGPPLRRFSPGCWYPWWSSYECSLAIDERTLQFVVGSSCANFYGFYGLEKHIYWCTIWESREMFMDFGWFCWCIYTHTVIYIYNCIMYIHIERERERQIDRLSISRCWRSLIIARFVASDF